MDAVCAVDSVDCRLTSVVGVLAEAVCLVCRAAVAVDLLVGAARSVCRVVCSGGNGVCRIRRDPISRGSQILLRVRLGMSGLLPGQGGLAGAGLDVNQGGLKRGSRETVGGGGRGGRGQGRGGVPVVLVLALRVMLARLALEKRQRNRRHNSRTASGGGGGGGGGRLLCGRSCIAGSRSSSRDSRGTAGLFAMVLLLLLLLLLLVGLTTLLGRHVGGRTWEGRRRDQCG